MVEEWNATDAAFPAGACVHELFEAQVERTPGAVAVVFEARRSRYAELNARANRLAHHLRALGVGPDARVAICVERGPEMVVGLLAMLKAGGAYVPLDPAYPADRLRYMLEDSAPAALRHAVVAGRHASPGRTCRWSSWTTPRAWAQGPETNPGARGAHARSTWRTSSTPRAPRGAPRA